jgi:annexin A7/11
MSQADAEALRNAMKGFGTDEAALIKICANRTNSQRQAIKHAYKSFYGRDLIADLKSELHGKFEDAMVALFTEPIEYDADQLREAMKGLGTNEDTLIEIIASRSTDPNRMKAIIQKYKEKYNRDLEADVKKETSGTLRHLLISLLQGSRNVNPTPNVNQMAMVAQEIYKAGEAKLGTDESVFNKYFCTLSPHELAAMAQQYHKLTGHTILQAIDKEFHGDSKKALRTIVYATLSPSEYFATRVNDAIKGWGTKDHLLIRILITRDEIDMPQIKQYYKQLYGKDMVQAVKSDISGDYQKLMVELCDH